MRPVSRSAPRKFLISSEEASLIKYQIELVTQPPIVKAGLQRLCGHLEQQQHLLEVAPFRNTTIGLIWTGEDMVRRWAYKVLAYIGRGQDVATSSERMRTEADPENLTWIMFAIRSLSSAKTVLEVCRETGTQYFDAMALASLLYGKEAVERIGADLPQVNVDTADALTLKWCALLAGYDKAPTNLLHPRFENKVLLGSLNSHNASEVAEYSVWALWKSPQCSLDDLRIPHHALRRCPENVRRWTNRLLAKHPQFLIANLDLFDHLCDDESLKAREGLALGLRDVHLPELEPHLFRWFSREPAAGLRELILEHWALTENGNTDLFHVLRDAYDSAETDGSLRRRLRAAVAGRGGRLYQAFNRIEAAGFQGIETPVLFGDDRPIIGGTTVNNTINVSGNLTAQNVAGGDIHAVANESVQQLKHQDANMAGVLEQIIALTKERDAFDRDQIAQVIAAVKAVASEPTWSNKSRLLSTLKAVGRTVSVASAAMKLPEFISTVSSWL
jgi:hypothetical protein